MNNKAKLQRYYLYGLVPILIFWLLLSIFFDQIYGVFFLLGYIWPYMYHTPGFAEKATSRTYRFSFLGNVFKFQNYIFSLLPQENPPYWMKAFAHLVVPFLFTGVLSILKPNWSPLWTFFGWLTFEGFVFLDKKLKWDLL